MEVLANITTLFLVRFLPFDRRSMTRTSSFFSTPCSTTHTHSYITIYTHIQLYIYIYMYVCVCVFTAYTPFSFRCFTNPCCCFQRRLNPRHPFRLNLRRLCRPNLQRLFRPSRRRLYRPILQRSFRPNPRRPFRPNPRRPFRPNPRRPFRLSLQRLCRVKAQRWCLPSRLRNLHQQVCKGAWVSEEGNGCLHGKGVFPSGRCNKNGKVQIITF